MWMFGAGLQLEQINNVDESNLQVRKVFAEQCGRSQRFLCWDIARRGKHNIRFVALIVAGPIPDTDALCAVGDGGVDVQELQMPLLVGDDDVDVVFRRAGSDPQPTTDNWRPVADRCGSPPHSC